MGGLSCGAYEALAVVPTGDCRDSSGGCRNAAHPEVVVFQPLGCCRAFDPLVAELTVAANMPICACPGEPWFHDTQMVNAVSG